jgi:hypothetical protein
MFSTDAEFFPEYFQPAEGKPMDLEGQLYSDLQSMSTQHLCRYTDLYVLGKSSLSLLIFVFKRGSQRCLIF